MERRMEIKGTQNFKNVVKALVHSGYRLHVSLFEETEEMFEEPIYLIEYALGEFDGIWFNRTNEFYQVVDDNGNPLDEYGEPIAPETNVTENYEEEINEFYNLKGDK